MPDDAKKDAFIQGLAEALGDGADGPYAIAFIDWEGRNYEDHDLHTDLPRAFDFVKQHAVEPISVGQYDVSGVLYAKSNEWKSFHARRGSTYEDTDAEVQQNDYPTVADYIKHVINDMVVREATVGTAQSIGDVYELMNKAGWLRPGQAV